MNRSIQVEGAFGVLKQDYGFGRFLTRGKTNNETRLFILATAFNIRKLCSRLADGRFGKALFEPKTAWNNLPRTTKPEQICLPYTKIALSAWAGFAWTEKCNVRHSTDCPPKKRKRLLQNQVMFAAAPFFERWHRKNQWFERFNRGRPGDSNQCWVRLLPERKCIGRKWSLLLNNEQSLYTTDGETVTSPTDQSFALSFAQLDKLRKYLLAYIVAVYMCLLWFPQKA